MQDRSQATAASTERPSSESSASIGAGSDGTHCQVILRHYKVLHARDEQSQPSARCA